MATVRRRYSPLGDPDFRRVFLSSVITKLGYWAGFVAIIGTYVFETEIGVLAIGVFGLIEIFPNLLLSPLSGVVTDRFGHKRVVIVTEAINGGAILTLAFVQSLPVAYAALFVVGAGRAASKPARKAIIPEIVTDDKELSRANGLVSSARSGAQIVGPGVGGALLIYTTPENVLIGDAATYVVSALLYLGITASRPETETDESLFGEVTAGLRAIVASRLVAAVIVVNVVLYAVLGLFDTMLSLYTREVLGLEATAFGLLISLVAVGSLTGGALMGAFGDAVSEETGVIAGVLLDGLVIGSFALADSYRLALIAATGIGFATSIAISYSITVLQRVADDDLLGRVFGVYDGTVTSGELVAIAFGSLLAAEVGVVRLYESLCLLTLVAGVGFSLVMWRSGDTTPANTASGGGD